MIIHLKKQTTFTLLVFALFIVALLFHVLAFATDNWCMFTLDDRKINLGLWQGCWKTDSGETCSKVVFENKAFNTGLGTDWHLGARALMILPLIFLLVLELAIVGYACLRDFDGHRNRFFVTIVTAAYSSAFCHLTVMALYSTEANKLPQGELKWSFGMVVLTFLIELAIPVLILADKIKRYPKPKHKDAIDGMDISSVDKHVRNPHHARAQNKMASAESNEGFDSSSEYSAGQDQSTRTSHTTLSSYPEYTRRPSYTGSIEDSSIYTESTLYTTLSYGQNSFQMDGSIESLV